MKSKNIKTLFIVALAVAAIVIYFVVNNKDKKQDFTIEDTTPSFKKEGELLFISNHEGDTLAVIDIEIADNEQKTAQGLMYRSADRKSVV